MRLLRRMVSKSNRRFQEDGFDLDLAYVTKRIIAMGFPSEGGEGLFRNPMSETTEFLARYHDGRFRVYNLCSEKAYDPAKLGGNVVRYPCDDLQAPPLATVRDFCRDASEWLDAGEDNIAVVHCKAGRGRTGVMICCLLLWRRMCAKPDEAIRLYGEARTTNGSGVTIPSQVRYIHHFFEMFLDGELCERALPLPERRLRFCSLRMLGMPRHLINGATIRLAARGRDDGPSCTEVFSVRATTRKEWRCFGTMPPRRQGEYRVHVPGSELVINRRTFRRAPQFRRRARGATCWRGRQRAPGSFMSSGYSTDWGGYVRAELDGVSGEKDSSAEAIVGGSNCAGTVADSSCAGTVCDSNCTGTVPGEDGEQGKKRGRRGAGREGCRPMDFVLDWDFTLQVFLGGGGGKEWLFHTWEHAAHVPESGLLVLKRDQLDKVRASVPTVVVELRLRDAADGDERENDEEEEDEGDVDDRDVDDPSEWSCAVSGLNDRNASEVAPSESESQASTVSHAPRRSKRSCPALGHLSWSWAQEHDADGDLARTSSRATHASWHSFDAAWSTGWLGAPGIVGDPAVAEEREGELPARVCVSEVL
eukprot:evm.model.scf_1977.5 EVM.evm.TU.scf_1977.5   scf_1977:26630-28399(-)